MRRRLHEIHSEYAFRINYQKYKENLECHKRENVYIQRRHFAVESSSFRMEFPNVAKEFTTDIIGKFSMFLGGNIF